MAVNVPAKLPLCRKTAYVTAQESKLKSTVNVPAPGKQEFTPRRMEIVLSVCPQMTFGLNKSKNA